MSLNQCTLGQSVSVSGASLHTGSEVVLTLHPAPPGHGMKFKRADLQDEPVIDARIDHVKTVERATTLIEGNAKVQTVEHVLSALTGMGVDNCLIEMDASEPPIGDGSAKQYVELIQKAGIVDQQVPRAVYEITEPIHIETKSGSLLTIVPDSKFRVSCTNVGPDGRACQGGEDQQQAGCNEVFIAAPLGVMRTDAVALVTRPDRPDRPLRPCHRDCSRPAVR